MGGRVGFGNESRKLPEKFAAYVLGKFGGFGFSAGFSASDSLSSSIGFGMDFDNMTARVLALADGKSDIRLSGGFLFDFKKIVLGISYLSRGDVGGSFLTTVRYKFDAPGIYGKFAASRLRAKKEARKFIRVGEISDSASSVDDFGVKQVWINFSADRKLPISDTVRIARGGRIISSAKITDTVTETPLVYEALVLPKTMKQEPALKDLVVINEKKMKKELASKRKKARRRLEKLRRKILMAKAFGWDVSAAENLFERAEYFLGKGDFDKFEIKISNLAGSIEKTCENSSRMEVSEVEDLLKDAKNLGVNVSYPESLFMRAKSDFKKKNYESGVANIREAKKWLEKTLNEIENETE